MALGFRLLILALIVGWVMTPQARAEGQEFENSVAMFNKGKIQDALKIWKKLAEVRHPDAMYRIGYLSHLGYGRFYPQSYEEAAVWYQKAADQGHALSQNSLALLYETGRGVGQDYVLAYMWFSLAARQGVKGASQSCDQIATKLVPPKLALAKKLVADWVVVEVKPPAN
ncbi:MAG: tetratricopeptide repeat protein [Proteobacteria bacterium]|nr:tetratricopeptide repeat protein [Pseudomonadota bacterium]